MGGGTSMRGQRVTPSGLVVAGVGFLLTRFTVTLVATEDPLRFMLGGVLPLVLGLSVTAYGIALTVGDFDVGYVRTTALWCVAGTLGMGLFVALTIYGAAPNTATSMIERGSDTYLSNLLIGGCVGGTVTGVFAARNRRRRIQQAAHAKRMVVLNHVFRDAVLNALTAIRGHLELLDDDRDDETQARAIEVIDDQTVQLEESVEEIRHLARGKTDPKRELVPVPLDDRLETCIANARERFPDADVAVEGNVPPIAVRADELVCRVFELVIENAIIHSDGDMPRVRIDVERDGSHARIAISDDGPGLPSTQQAMLAAGTVDEFDDPSTGFGLNVATLLAESYQGRLDATVTDDGTTIDVSLPLARGDRVGGDSDQTAGATGSTRDGPIHGVPNERLVVAACASILAGVLMSVVMATVGGGVPVIGALYGVADPAVGLLTHEFHSVIFGLLYLVVLAVAPWRLGRTHIGRIGLGVAWGVALWLVAAGFVMPLWLQLVGMDATVPTLAVRSLVGHVVWGLSVGAIYSLAISTGVPESSRRGDVAVETS